MGRRNLDDDDTLMGRLEDGDYEHGKPKPGRRRRRAPGGWLVRGEKKERTLERPPDLRSMRHGGG
jgi:hypothetical protein